jgi:hypothetical protein
VTCRWDREAEAYLADGEPCRTDDYGDPTVHCTARRACGNHVGRGELTCAQCVGRVRQDIRTIVARSAELLPEAVERGVVTTEALNLASPAADVRTWSERRVAMKAHLLTWEALARITAKQYVHARATMEDDDEHHPYTVLTRWELMLREDYDQPRTTPTSISAAADYLERTLPRLAQDPEQDFRNFRNEIRKCRSHLEATLRDSQTPERGAPCPDCLAAGRVVKLDREYPHWCDDEACERIHYSVMMDKHGEIVPDTTHDRWVCPRGHWRSHEDYQRWIEERHDATA